MRPILGIARKMEAQLTNGVGDDHGARAGRALQSVEIVLLHAEFSGLALGAGALNRRLTLYNFRLTKRTVARPIRASWAAE